MGTSWSFDTNHGGYPCVRRDLPSTTTVRVCHSFQNMPCTSTHSRAWGPHRQISALSTLGGLHRQAPCLPNQTPKNIIKEQFSSYKDHCSNAAFPQLQTCLMGIQLKTTRTALQPVQPWLKAHTESSSGLQRMQRSARQPQEADLDNNVLPTSRVVWKQTITLDKPSMRKLEEK